MWALGTVATFAAPDDYTRTILDVSACAGVGLVWLGINRDSTENGISPYAIGGISGALFAEAALIGAGALVRRPVPRATLAAHYESIRSPERRSALTADQLARIEADFRRSSSPLPRWVLAAPLFAGRMVAQVSKREGKPFVVRSHDVRVEVVGTIFAVETRDAGEVSVSVVAGIVNVSRGGETRRLAPGEVWPNDALRLTVTSAELAWATSDARAPAEPHVSAEVPVPANTNESPRPVADVAPTDREPPPLAASGPSRTQNRRPPSAYGAAKELEAKGDLKGALDAYDAVARSAHKNAEDALFATARLRAKLADTDGALESFRSYRRRYPDGAYARGVAVHVLDLLVKRGDDSEILDEANAFLAAYPNDLRAWRFRMARGAIAIKKGDCPSALRDLASVPDVEATPLRRRCKASRESER